MAARRTALLVYRGRGGGNDAHHPTVFCYTNIEPRAASLEIVRSTKKVRWVPVDRASERHERSDLICDRETSRLLTIAPVPSITANLHHLRIYLFPRTPPSPRVFRPSYLFLLFVVSPSSSLVVHSSRASSRAEFIPPAKYPRIRLPISPPSSPFRFSPPSIAVLSASKRVFPFLHYLFRFLRFIS